MEPCPHCGHRPPTQRELLTDLLVLTIATGVAYGRYSARRTQDAKVREFRDRLDRATVVEAGE